MKGTDEQNTIETKPLSELQAERIDYLELRVRELRHSIKIQLDTIETQNITLENRQKLVDNLEFELELANNQSVPVPTKDTLEIAVALQAYANNIAANATTSVHAEICVNIIQLALQLKKMQWDDAIKWLYSDSVR